MRRNHTLWRILVIVLALELGGCIPTELLPTPTTPPPSVEPRQIAENTLGLREYWRAPLTSYVGGALAAVPGRVVYIDYVSDVPHVRVLDATNGGLLWEVVERHGHAWMAADAERVYLDDSHRELHAYDMEDGRQLWTRRFTPHRGRSYDPDGDKLYIRQGGAGEDFLYTLDAQTGDILSTESLWTADHILVFSRLPQVDIQFINVQNPITLRTVDPTTQKTLWQVERTPDLSIRNPRWPPVLLDDVLLIDIQSEVIAFDAQSGQVRWRTLDPVHSSETRLAAGAVMAEDSLYVLRRDARLVRLDARTGQEIGYIQFTPPLLSHDDVYWGGNWPGLATDGQMIFVSFDDSRELIALGP